MNCNICGNKLNYNNQDKRFFCEKCNNYYDINLNKIDDLNLYRKIENKVDANNYKKININCNNCNGKLVYNKDNKTFFCIECNKYYDIELKEINNIKLYVPRSKTEKETINNIEEVKCPICGSTQIQVVNRKWSIWTGILTNKVNRVCINCKHKF